MHNRATEAQRQAVARNGQRGNIVVAARAALNAQRFVMLLEEGHCFERARLKLGVAERTARRYRERWGR